MALCRPAPVPQVQLVLTMLEDLGVDTVVVSDSGGQAGDGQPRAVSESGRQAVLHAPWRCQKQACVAALCRIKCRQMLAAPWWWGIRSGGRAGVVRHALPPAQPCVVLAQAAGPFEAPTLAAGPPRRHRLAARPSRLL